MFAIVGIAAQLPSGQFATKDLDYEGFWKLLSDGASAFEDLDQLKVTPNPFVSVNLSDMPRKGAFLKSMTEFDYSSFGISSDDARVMPNSARRLMELSFRALLDSGIQTRGQSIGCFMSGNNDLNLDNMNSDGSLIYLPSSIPNRISYALNLTGPSIAIDTACSSSLTGLHLATSAIKNGDCTAALVGAAQSNRNVVEWWRYDKAHILSPEGICKPFDEQADGFARGEGAVVVVIKSLQNALHDNDHIYCTIAASSHAATGSEFPIYVPNGPSQQQVISQAYEKAGREPTEADYVELHMTGTRVGDPIEANAAAPLFCRNGANIRVGSVKGNIGHLEGAAFLASLVKVCHIFDKGTIPPTPNFSAPNRAIHWHNCGIEVVTKPVALGCKTKGRRPLISIASAGIGGSHGHVLLEGPPPKACSPHTPHETSVLFLIGGLTPAAADTIAQEVARLPHDPEAILANAVHASRQARQLPWRSFLIHKSNSISLGKFPRPVLVPTKAPRLAFVFSGQGPHNAQMGHQLFRQYSVFRNTVIELDETHQKVMGYSLLESTGLFSGEITDSRILQRKWPVILTLPALVMVQIGIFELLKSIGVSPDYLLGHSAGETAIVYASGAGPKAMAMEIALARGRAMTCVESIGAGMAVIASNAAACQALIDQVNQDNPAKDHVEISCFNATDSVTISGKTGPLDAAVSLAKGQGIFAQRINTLVPGHSKYIEYCREEHNTLIESIFARYPGPHTPNIPVFSTCRPGEIVQEFTPKYFWDNVRNPVCFSDAISLVFARNNSSMFVEISPHPVLSGTITSYGTPSTRAICPMQRFPKGVYDLHHETTCFLTNVAQLALAGYDRIDLSRLYGTPKNHKPLFNHPLRSSQVSLFKTFETVCSKTPTPLLSSLPSLSIDALNLFSQHRVGDVPAVSGTGWIEMALEAGGRCLWDVEFHSLYSFRHNRVPALYFEQEGRNKWSITSTRTVDAFNTQSRTLIATGCLGKSASSQRSMENLNIMALQEKLNEIPLENLHTIFGDKCYYGTSFTRIVSLRGNPSEMLAEVRGLDKEERSAGYVLHPGALDACLRVVAYRELLQVWDTGLWLPKHIRRFTRYKETGSSSLFAYIRLNRWEPDSRTFDISITNDQGSLICEFEDFTLRRACSHVISKPRRALKLTSEPFSIPNTIFPASRFLQTEDKDGYTRLFRVLDHLIFEQILKTLELQPHCGKSVDRSRYLERMTELSRIPRTFELHEESEIREQRLKWPAYFETTRRLGQVHEDILLSSQVAVNALFADDLMSQYYVEHNLLSGACEEASHQFDNILKTLSGSGKYTVKVLEIGAGTGMLTRQLVSVIKNNPQVMVEYTVTDVSYSLVEDLAKSLELDRLIPKVYDATKDPCSQGHSPESYDIIVAYHVLHVAPELKTLAWRLHNLLVPGGFLLAVEVDNTAWSDKPGAAWMDFTLGSFAEWFSYHDERDHCSMSPLQWEALLQSSDFTNFSTIVGSNYCLDFVFTCQKKPESGRMTIEPIPTVSLYHYKDGEELELQCFCRAFNPAEHGIMCLWTNSRYDGDSAMGLVMTLAKEFTTWIIWLAMFDVDVDITRVEDVIRTNHLHLARERLVYFSAEGTPSFPRVVPLPPISDEHSVRRLPLSKNHLVVQAIDRDLGGFIGEVVKSKDPEILEGSTVAGLDPNVRGKALLTVHSGSIVNVDQPDRRILPYLPAMLLQFQCLESFRFMHSLYDHPSLRILIALRSHNLAQALSHLLNASSCGVTVLTEVTNSFVDVVVTDQETLEANPSLEQNVGTNGRMVIWSFQLIEKVVSHEPWILRHVFRAGFHNFKFPPIETPEITDPDGVVNTLPPNETTDTPLSLLDPHRVYLLIGGIGGIGLHLAVWLYQNGARHIYLTSRRGRESVLRAEDALLKYKLQYLEGLTDLDLRLVACDALNASETKGFLDSVKLPIAGCFLLPLILRDSLFLNQTVETMGIVKRSKVEAFNIITCHCDVKAMDFLVAFSSVTALWGIPGQSNYGSACAILDGKMSEFPNAFALLVPAIMDAGYFLQAGNLDRLGLRGAEEWGIGVEELCEYVRDGIRRVKQGINPSIYIPDIDTRVLTKHFALPPLYHFLIPLSSPINAKGQLAGSQNPENSSLDAQDVVKAVREIVRTTLGIHDEDAFSSDIPLIHYGLDSIRATRLSRQLKPYIEIPQADFLIGMSWTKLEERVKGDHLTKLKSLDVLETRKGLILSSLGYGRDSIRLGVTQLSRRIRPHVQISHMGLLLGLSCMSWLELKTKITQLNFHQHQEQRRTLKCDGVEDCRKLVVESLGVDSAAFDPDIPFINYGLDSIRATRLSRQLQPYVEIPQMDLLLGMAWRGLEEKILSGIYRDESASTAKRCIQGTVGPKRWLVSFTKLNESTGDGPIVLALPGATGALATISPIMNHGTRGSSTIWAAHFDASECDGTLLSLQDLGNEILGGFKERCPHGALRIISFSGSSTLAFVLAQSFEAEGRQVLNISFLDHFPALFCHDAYGLVRYIESRDGDPEASEALDDIAERGTELMLRMQENDPTMQKKSPRWGEHDRAKVEDSLRGLSTARMLVKASVAFIKSLYYQSRNGFETYDEVLVRWLGIVNAPLLVVIADKGFNQVVESPWTDMGASKLLEHNKNIQVLRVDAAHFEVVGCETVSRKLCL